MLNLILITLATVLLCWSLTALLLWTFRILKISQPIRKEAPDRHQLKAGTPTMGGVAIVLAALIVLTIWIDFNATFWVLLGILISFGVIGLSDDFLKLLKKKNLGLRFWQKLILQIAAASIFAAYLILKGHHLTVSPLLFFLGLNTWWLYMFFTVFIIVGAANAVNLSDGLDGLAAGTLSFSFFAYALLTYWLKMPQLSILCFAIGVGALTFLRFNHYPAQIFMGDAGSLGLGAILGAVAVLAHRELLLMIIGGVFVVEALSVIIQVTYFKFTRKRIFKMSPYHHHFELLGIPEPKIVYGFWSVGFLLAIFGILFEVLA